ncbi:MAG: hypothetical protein ABL933_08985 [Methyloglobulus sp.]|nr:hypothetical protein [Methyloglobulus sp.]
MPKIQPKEAVSINIRAKAKQRDLIDQAFFSVDAGTFAKFQALLDQPLPPADKLRRLLKTKAPWEK